jgi:hypothetical protein
MSTDDAITARNFRARNFRARNFRARNFRARTAFEQLFIRKLQNDRTNV